MRKERSRRAIPLDELIGQDVQQHKRAMRLLLSGMALLSVLLIAVVLFGVDARRETVAATAQLNRASINQSRLLASASRLAGCGKRGLEAPNDIAMALFGTSIYAKVTE